VRSVATSVAALATAALACAPALREPPPIVTAPTPASADELLRIADAAWAKRADPGKARAAQEAYLQAAAADETRVEGLVGAMRAAAFRIERERDGAERERLAVQAVQLGQWCQRRAPSDAVCGYRLALALGQQTRERTSTAKDALGRMEKLLRAAIAADPAMDRGGPHRTLALLLLRAPGWPVGPGDTEGALVEARAAVDLFPDAPHNQLALAEALARNDHAAEARAAYERAAALAEPGAAAGDPEATRWREEALAALAHEGPR
jgi:hypothetical protein